MKKDPELMDRLEKKFKLGSAAYGSFTNETTTPITSFCCISSKNYSLRCQDGFEKVRVRGFSLQNKTAKSQINHDTMRSMLLDAAAGIDRSVDVENFAFQLDVKNQRVITRPVKKVYRNWGITPKRFLPLPQDMPRDKFLTLLPFGIKHTNFADVPK